MGGSTKSETANQTTTTTTNKSNSVGVGGDNSGIILSGNEGDINLTQTDHGSVDAAFEFGDSALSEAFGFGESALEAMNNSTQSALAFAGAANASANTGGASDVLDSKFLVYMGAGVGLVLLLVIIMAVRK